LEIHETVQDIVCFSCKFVQKASKVEMFSFHTYTFDLKQFYKDSIQR